MKYRPLDLSFIQAKYSPQQNDIRNTAQMILANAGWSQPSQVTLKEIADAQKKANAAAAHKATPLSGLFDLLSTPLYAVANALDEALAGHQSDPNDSVISDIGKTAGGIFTGAFRGAGAGLRGATSLIDVLPGVDINDEWQANPEDKTHFSDVALRQNVGMSTADAMKPENWSKVKGKLEKINEKSVWDKTFSQLFIPDNLDDPDAREKYFRNNALAGIPSDILGDPLNLVLFGGKSAVTAPKAIEEGLNAARSGGSKTADILSGLKAPIYNSNRLKNLQPGKLPFEIKPETVPSISPEAEAAQLIDGTPRVTLPQAPISAIDETVAPGTLANVTHVAHDLPKGHIPTLGSIGGRGTTPKAGLEVSLKDQKTLTKGIVELAARGEKGWLYRAADLMRKHPGVTWTKTEAFLQKANQAVKRMGLKHNPAAMAPALAKHIAEDVADARKVTPAERILNDGHEIVIRPGATKLKRSEAQLANRVVRRFEAEILGKARAPGTGEGLARAIASGQNVRFSGPQQARLWNQITSNLKYANPAKFDKTVRILRAIEDYFIGKGAIPHSATRTAKSVPLRLSQVAEAIGPQILGKSHAFITGVLRGDPKAMAQLPQETLQKIEQLKASESLASAPAVQKGIEVGKNLADELTKIPRSIARMNPDKTKVIQSTKLATAEFGGGDVGTKIAGEYMGNLLGKSDPINAALSANRFKTEAWLSKNALDGGKVNDANFLKSVTNAIVKAADLPAPAKLGVLSGPKALVSEWLGARFNAAYGVQDMRPIFLREQASAMSTTARRAKLLNELGRRFPPTETDLWHEAFRTAQMNGIADGRVAELHAEIAKVMENLFGGSGLRNGGIVDSTVVGRNRILLSELNVNLKRFGLGGFQFSAGKKVKDAVGVERDFSQGLDWMKSWEAWNVKNPYDFLHKIQTAVEFTIREKTMFDEIASRFASPFKKGNVKYGVEHPRLRGFYFNEEGARQATQFVKMLKEVSTPNSKGLQYVDHVISKIKASLTIYWPGHHFTNLIGDTYYNWIAGVNNPRRYDQAMKTMLAQKGRYGDFASFNQLAGPDAVKQAIARSFVKPDAGLAIPATGNKTIITMKNGTRVTADMIYTAAMREGILPSAKVLEEVESSVTSVLDKVRPLGGKGQRAVHNVSEIRDHIPRLAQFIDGLAKHRGSFTSAAESSAAAVRKWHPDGLDLTQFERQVMKRVFPFYSWTRKAIPLAIESAIFAGPKVMAYPRLMEALALSNGVEAQNGTTEPFPVDQLFPDWIRARGIGPIAGGPGNYLVVNPSTPVLDMFTLMGQPGRSAIDMLNPLVKVPIETASGSTLGQNAPITNYPDYFSRQIPAVSHLGRASGQFGVSSGTKAEGFPNWTNIINILTGLKMIDTGKYQKSGQFDLRDYLKTKSQQQFR